MSKGERDIIESVLLPGEEIIWSGAPATLKWVELEDRIGAEGYSDIIWQRRPVETGSDTQSTPIAREKARVGFKALPNGAEVFALIEHWREGHAREPPSAP